MSASTVFYLGATGYVGGSALVSLVKRYPNFTWTALVRNPKDVSAVEAVGRNVKVVIGSHSDLNLIEVNAKEHDITINTADSDDVPLVEAIVRGQEIRAASGTRKPILIHTSGSGLIIDEPKGTFNPKALIYDDKDVESIKNIPDAAFHRNVDNVVFAAGEKGLIDTYIISPATIYGKGRGPVRTTSIQINGMIRAALRRRKYLQVGPGTNNWSGVHIDDLAELYGLVLDLALSGKNTNKSYANFFWAAHGTFIWGDINAKLAKIMHQKGLIDSPDVGPVTPDVEMAYALASHNCRVVSNRAYGLGWRPTAQDINNEEVLIQEVDNTVAAFA